MARSAAVEPTCFAQFLWVAKNVNKDGYCIDVHHVNVVAPFGLDSIPWVMPDHDSKPRDGNSGYKAQEEGNPIHIFVNTVLNQEVQQDESYGARLSEEGKPPEDKRSAGIFVHNSWAGTSENQQSDAHEVQLMYEPPDLFISNLEPVARERADEGDGKRDKVENKWPLCHDLSLFDEPGDFFTMLFIKQVLSHSQYENVRFSKPNVPQSEIPTIDNLTDFWVLNEAGAGVNIKDCHESD